MTDLKLNNRQDLHISLVYSLLDIYLSHLAIKKAICKNKEAFVTSLFECVKKCRSWPFSIVHFCTFRDSS